MEHLHTFDQTYVGAMPEYHCPCGTQYRLATYDEAVFVQRTEGWAVDGPLRWKNNLVLVPLDFSLWQEA